MPSEREPDPPRAMGEAPTSRPLTGRPDLRPLLLEIPERLVTPRLRLRPVRPGDGPVINAAVLESLPELRPWMPWAERAPSVEDSEEVARRMWAAFLARTELNWAFFLGETEELAGVGGIHNVDWRVPRGEIGYWVRTRLAGRGLVREAVEALTRLGFGHLGLARIEIRCDPRNERSAHVARAAGYQLEATLRCESRGLEGGLRDTLVFARVASSEPLPTSPPGYQFRPPVRADLPAIRDLLVACDRADQTERAESLTRLQESFEDEWSDPRTDAVVARDRRGGVVAWARCYLHPAPTREARLHFIVEVHPEHRAGEVLPALFETIEARGLARLALAPPGIPRMLMMPFDVADEGRRLFLEARGYSLERVFYRMLRNLGESIPEPEFPAELDKTAWNAAQDPSYHAAFNETFADHWSFEPVTADDWRQFFTQSSMFRPEFTRGLFHGPELVAFSLNYVDPEENERLGRRQGWIGQLGVRRAWRKRGLATALLCESMRAFRAAGLGWAVLGVDADSLTGAVAVYERVGFVVTQRTVCHTRRV